jgi:ribosomal protein L37AE/L43A
MSLGREERTELSIVSGEPGLKTLSRIKGGVWKCSRFGDLNAVEPGWRTLYGLEATMGRD